MEQENNQNTLSKKLFSNWRFALSYLLGVNIIANIILRIVDFLIIEPFNITFAISALNQLITLIVWIFGIWFGSWVIFSYLNRRYKIQNRNKVLNLAIIYAAILYIVGTSFSIWTIYTSGISILVTILVSESIISLLSIAIFYFFSRKYIKTMDEVSGDLEVRAGMIENAERVSKIKKRLIYTGIAMVIIGVGGSYWLVVKDVKIRELEHQQQQLLYEKNTAIKIPKTFIREFKHSLIKDQTKSINIFDKEEDIGLQIIVEDKETFEKQLLINTRWNHFSLWGDSIAKSKDSKLVAYIDEQLRLIVSDTVKSTVLISDYVRQLLDSKILGDYNETCINTGIIEWSPDSNKLIYNIYTSVQLIDCPVLKEEYSKFLGFYLVDFSSNNIHALHINSHSYPSAVYQNEYFQNFIFEGWLDNDSFLLMDDYGILWEYNIPNSQIFIFERFGVPTERHGLVFSFRGSIDGLYVWMDGNTTLLNTQIYLFDGQEERVIASGEWGEIQPNDISISYDGKYIFYRKGSVLSGKDYYYDIKTRETKLMTEEFKKLIK